MNDKSVLSCRNLSKSYDEGPQSVQVLSGVELNLLPGERVAIVGSSGSGRSWACSARTARARAPC